MPCGMSVVNVKKSIVLRLVVSVVLRSIFLFDDCGEECFCIAHF